MRARYSATWWCLTRPIGSEISSRAPSGPHQSRRSAVVRPPSQLRQTTRSLLPFRRRRCDCRSHRPRHNRTQQGRCSPGSSGHLTRAREGCPACPEIVPNVTIPELTARPGKAEHFGRSCTNTTASSHEQELRALIPEYDRRDAVLEGRETPAGLDVPVRLVTLIESVWVAPVAPVWVEELVEAMVRRYGLEVPVERSKLAAGPTF